ncbi:MalY/PatB family protein [Silvimonas iriomotensis]|uniref:Putative 8-amino-7-oxononanoate synthase n=1 Tax=Silvimonas iriomotensis TaxID=449662 RepID=A0ABQ2PC57_9NEIS|nr:PatB family C-S lyase [Silvimonas iriomotensis]GGP22991.1 aspartate aminotransferase [Silvimonas iriomotensis]
MFDFDTVINRRDSDSTKWRKYDEDVLPLWVADMDFASPPAIASALQERVAHGVFGYPDPQASLVQTLVMAMQRDYNWQIQPDWLVPLPGLVVGLNVACRATGSNDDPVLTATPVYPPFMSAPILSQRRLVRVPMLEAEGSDGTRWAWDIDQLVGSLGPGNNTLMLCHPHNPVGRVWRTEELLQLAAVAQRHDMVVVSDEIHCDLILDAGHKHVPFAALSPDAAQRSITLMAPSKTYNVPGLGCSFAIIPNPALRKKFTDVMRGIVPHVNIFGYVACEAAYRDGVPWRTALLDVLRRNRDLVMQQLDGYLGLRVTRPEATYLAWVDCRNTGIEDPAAFFEAAGVGLSNGVDFGLKGFVRLNFGCALSTLQDALHRMREALANRTS